MRTNPNPNHNNNWKERLYQFLEIFWLGVCLAIVGAIMYALWTGITSPIPALRTTTWIVIAIIALWGFFNAMANRTY